MYKVPPHCLDHFATKMGYCSTANLTNWQINIVLPLFNALMLIIVYVNDLSERLKLLNSGLRLKS